MAIKVFRGSSIKLSVNGKPVTGGGFCIENPAAVFVGYVDVFLPEVSGARGPSTAFYRTRQTGNDGKPVIDVEAEPATRALVRRSPR